MFNDYLGSLTNTPVIQRLLGCLTITAEQNASIRAKSTKPRRRIACSGVRLCAETSEKPYFKRFSGVEKVHRNSIKITVDLWRSGWDSNPRNLAVQLISSQSRYDHFDTAPYLSQHQHLGKRGELMGRTSKNIKLRIPEKPRKIKGFRLGSYRVATTISSQPRYDHFDTSPYLGESFRTTVLL